MPETIAGDMIEPHFDHQFGPNRLPFATALGAPAAGPPGAFPVKPGGLRIASSLRVSSPLSSLAMVEVKPT
ncbi:hypothetical protein IQ26_05486 [Mesorhizobium tianshanense]|uniref:Uncharacterized protein n=1 Tax=Mesorhizobium tianshanense TaxID=39844 RepID=A0A562N7D8_9HYPH|nr:hypothetical protein IQ26_05486 [Mesorhizobium tianshanense]